MIAFVLHANLLGIWLKIYHLKSGFCTLFFSATFSKKANPGHLDDPQCNATSRSYLTFQPQQILYT